MQIGPEHIKQKQIVGKLKNGMPVFYIETYGGLHVILGNPNGKVEILSAMPHKGMSVWLAEKKHPEIQWDRQTLLGVK